MFVIIGKSGVGKTTILKSLNINNIFFADEFVKKILYKNDHEVAKIIYLKWPEVKGSHYVDTKKLGKILFKDISSLNVVHKIVKPYVREKIKNLSKNAVVEMGSYINYENEYKDLFDKVIMIKRDTQDLSKFNHIQNMEQPIKENNVHFDYIIENNGLINKAALQLKKIIMP